MRDINNLTYEEQILKKIIIREMNELVGGYENTYTDDPKEFYNCNLDKLTKNDVIESIYYEIMKGTSPVLMIGCGWGIERKHIKFLGKKFVKALIEQCVNNDYHKHGWLFPNNYDAA